MDKLLTIAKKELGTYFKSPLAYIVLIITISVFNFFFFVLIDHNREASLRDMFQIMEFMFVFIIPLLTMKIFAEEKRNGTMEFLLTCPITPSQLVLGKYLGTLLFFSLIISLTFSYFVLISTFAHIDTIATCVGYTGVWLEGALFISVGILMSSITRNQLIAAISSYAILLTLYFSSVLAKFFDPGLRAFFNNVSFYVRNENLSSGLVASADCVYFVSVILFCLMLTILHIQKQR